MPLRKLVLSLLLVTGALGTVAACAGDEQEQVSPIQGTMVGIDVEAIDKSVDPGNDFYLYANGNWLASAEIPAGRSATGSFPAAQDRARERLQQMMAQIAAKPQEAGTPDALLRQFYLASMDTEAIDRAGRKPLRADLARFAAIEDVEGLSRVLGQQMRATGDPRVDHAPGAGLFGLFVGRGSAGEEALPYLLPGRPAAEAAGQSEAYRAYIARILRLAGLDDAVARARRVTALESSIAEATGDVSYSSAEEWSRAQFAQQAPGIEWEGFFEAALLPNRETILAADPDAVAQLSALVASEPVDVWKDWLAFRQIDAHADVLPRAVRSARFAFHEQRLQGSDEARPRGEKTLEALGRHFGDALGQAYADRYFSREERRDIEIMVRRIKSALADRVRALGWLAPETRDAILRQVRAASAGFDFSQEYKAPAGFKLNGKSAYGMAVAAERAAYRQQLARIGTKGADPEWRLAPRVADALNLPLRDALAFPAALLQPPFYDPEADAAANYGAIGAIIGHELSHSLGAGGFVFAGSGAVQGGWSEDDAAALDERGQALAQQYSRYRPFADAGVNGEGTLAENIADLAGLAAAHDAYRASLRGKEPPVIAGFTGDQRFFIAYAQAWALKMNDARLRRLLAADNHMPGRYRALTVRNLDAWYRAFNVEEGDSLYLTPEDRVRIW